MGVGGAAWHRDRRLADEQNDLRLRFVALDADGKRIRGRKVSVALYSRQVLTARRRLIGGFDADDN